MSVYEVGQAVLIVGGYYRSAEPREGTVTKVARKYVTVQQGGPHARLTTEFDMATGYARSDVGSRMRVYTPEAYAEAQEKRELTDRLRKEHGLTVSFGQGPTLAQLRAIIAAMEADA